MKKSASFVRATHFLVVMIGLCALIGSAPPAQADFSLRVLFEGFEGAFPDTWFDADLNANGTPSFWDDVDAAFGGEGAHTGNWKGYCAGSSFGGTAAAPIYQDFMAATMRKSINLSGFGYANLRFWHKVPGIEPCCDRGIVTLDGVTLHATTGVLPDWTEVRVSLNGFVGASRDLAFQFLSDLSVADEGWYLDDIEVTGANAPLTEQFTSVEIVNYTGFLVASDVLTADPAYNRESILARSEVAVENFTPAVTGNLLYTLRYQLLDDSSAPVPIRSNGVPVLSWTFSTNVVLSAAQKLLLAHEASLQPAGRLDPYSTYRVDVHLLRNGVDTGVFGSDSPKTYLHFTNTISGDAAANVIPRARDARYSRIYAIATVPGKNSFVLDVDYELWRYDNFAGLNSDATVGVVLNVELRTAGLAPVPLVSSTFPFLETLPSFTAGFPNSPALVARSRQLEIKPASQIDSVNQTYFARVTITHTNTPGQPLVTGNTVSTPLARLLHFSGNLWFGPVRAIVDSIDNIPLPGMVSAGAISSELFVSAGGGHVDGNPGHTFGSGAPLAVGLQVNGDALYRGGAAVLVTAPSVPDRGQVNGVSFFRSGTSLTSTGATSFVLPLLPTGSSYRLTNDPSADPRAYYGVFVAGTIALNQSLAPAADVVFAPPGGMWVSEESKPIAFTTPSLTWVIGGGYFQLAPPLGVLHVRAPEQFYIAFIGTNVVDQDARNKRANDWHYLVAHSPSGVRLNANANGVAEIDFSLQFNNGFYAAQFPYDAPIVWTNGGSMQVTRDLVVGGSASELRGVWDIPVRYVASCDGCGATPFTNTVTFHPSNAVLRFTRDGGLVATGAPTTPHLLGWGRDPVSGVFAHAAQAQIHGAFHMPGHFLKGGQNQLDAVNGPGTILLSGVAATNLNRVERPYTTGYLEGFADYAGINFRCLSDGAFQGYDRVGGAITGNFPLRGRSKYYARLAGVSGIHEAASFPSAFPMMGYQFTLQNYGLSFLDSQNKDSRVNGSLFVPAPSAVALPFEKLKLNCPGGLESAEVAPGVGFRQLQYWAGDFEPLAIQFKRNAADECDPGKGSLVVGVRAYAKHVDQALSGQLGFQTNGNLIPASFGLDGIDSRLKAQPFKVRGPAGLSYHFTPVADVYYNNPSNSASGKTPAVGYLNMAGRLDVPFFEDLKVQIQTSAGTNPPSGSTAPIYMMGGWPRDGSGNANHGWRVGTNDFFNRSAFDPDNYGFPTSITTAAYRQGAADDYHPRAQKLWFGVVDFDYPLEWSTSLRTFKSSKQSADDFFVLKVQHEITYLDPQSASLDFGIQYDGLPKISVGNMVFNAVDGQLGVTHALGQAIGNEARDVLLEGSQHLLDILSDTPQRLLDQVFRRTVDQTIEALYAQMNAQWLSLPLVNRTNFPALVPAILNDYLGGNGPSAYAQNAVNQLQNLANGAAQPLGLLKELQDRITEITNGLSAITDTISVGTNGLPLSSVKNGLLRKVGADRPLVKNLVGDIVGDIAQEFINAVAEPELSNLTKKVDPALDEIASRIRTTQKLLGAVNEKLNLGSEFQADLNTRLAAAAGDISNAMATAQSQLQAHFNSFNYRVDNPFDPANAAPLKLRIRNEVMSRMLALSVSQDLQAAIRQRIYDLDATFRESLDSAFQQVNTIIRSLISETLAGLDNTINGALGDLGNVIGAGQIDGHALINGDSLKCLRLDGKFQWKVPDELEFGGYLQIKELDSTGTPGCGVTSVATATEVALGATGVPLSWLSDGATVDVGTKFTFQNAPFRVVGMAGSFNMNGSLNFESFELYKLAAGVAFVRDENYLTAAAGLRLRSYDISGGIFFGRTCTLDPIKLWAPDVAGVLGNPPFTGAYVYGEGWIPISEAVLGIPASCMFNISAGIGAGAFFFLEGPTYGGKIKAGISGEALCLVSIKGEVEMIGVKNGGNLRMKGTGRLRGKAGACPFCVKFSETVGMTYENGSWDIDY